MGSLNAQSVARKVSENISKGKRVILADVLKDSGYSHSVTRRPSTITNTKSFKQAFAVEQRPILEGLQEQINKIKDAIARKDIDDEEYRILVASLDVLIKNYQLLSGGATERQVFVLPSEVMKKNEIASAEDKKLLDNGSTEPK